MNVTWWSVDFKTGVRGQQLHVASKGRLSRIIGTSTDTTISVRVADQGKAIPGWDEATTPGRTMIVAVDSEGGQPIWGALVRRRQSTKGPWVEVTANTLEAYFSRRYISTLVSWTDADPSTVAASVLALITDLPPMIVQTTLVGNPVLDGFHDISDNKRIGDVLTDLSGLTKGIEWTVDLEWSNAEQTTMRYVVRVAPRLGTAATGSATQWTMPGCVRDFSFIEDFGEENGANDIYALSSGEGTSKPRSTRYEDTALLNLYARFQRWFTPATSITSTTTLDQYAEAELARTRLGISQLTIEANLDAAPRVNLDWWMGDDIDVSLTCDRFPATVNAQGFKDAGYTRRLRTVGWDLDLDSRTLTPRIVEAA